MALLDWVHDAGRVITSIDNRSDILCNEIQRLKEGANPKAVVAVERWASDAQALVENLQTELEEARHQQESTEKELSETRVELIDSRKLLAEAQGQLTRSGSGLRTSRTNFKIPRPKCGRWKSNF
ncbi:hypothetical protein BHE74_00038686 [Ensete ventricosum]|nr:hypothetical protein GW17_00045770 [Ensete ventricosum]RWW54774.1 hypothetical protein BHE74_00038686 [Ensete ventricosum]RZS14667.1 hypothetical protein BHM03_00046395 [Ensete ventricosum]